jgi:hypothetical protein
MTERVRKERYIVQDPIMEERKNLHDRSGRRKGYLEEDRLFKDRVDIYKYRRPVGWRSGMASGRLDEGYFDTVNALSCRKNSMATPFLVCSILLTVPSPLRIRVCDCPVISGGRYR